ncbi:Glucan endo-1,3-beta-glucosidase 14 [Dichanthelium oligosanthes]|uniref:glucan endo-1,3-beta-D-glucosidase n=1 Tax=Dichanthelium oligosanthes TaxID=888268 RepID=A0A1E5W0K3_9POAL|nr:Glucan endo-1,3-beta-glucosidase 14 [Dichanthelium oligosanthes]
MAVALLSRSSRLVICALLFISLFSEVGVLRRAAALGINYGQVGNNLPPPPQVVQLLASLRIGKVRIYDINPQVLSAFAGTGIELIVTVPDDLVPGMAASPSQALQWVTAGVRPYFPATRVTGIAVGNEVFTGDDEQLKASLVPAMRNLHAALAQLGMDAYVRVSTANSLAVLATSYPPSQGVFTQQAAPYMAQLLRFLAETSAPFWINAYPYFAYKDDPTKVSLDYALSNPYRVGAVDPYTHLQYTSMLYAQVDAVTFAAARLGYGNVPVHVSETGWPSKGDANEAGATVENARQYNRNLLMRQVNGEGTPLRPKLRLEVYLFALFNEDMKPGPTSERNYGLYQPDMSMVYNVGLNQLSTTSAAASLSSLATSPASRTVSTRLVLHESFINFSEM